MNTYLPYKALAATPIFWTSVAFAAGSEDYHGESSAGLPQMDPTWFASQIFWLTVVFITLYIIFSRSILPALAGTIETRRERIQSDLDNARDMKNEAENVQEEYEQALSDARANAAELFTSMENDIKRKTANEIGKMRTRSLEEIQKTDVRLNKEKEKALKEMDEIAAEIASIAAEKIVGISTDIKQAKTVIKNINKKAA